MGPEAKLEVKVRNWAKDNGWKRKKMSSPGTSGTLDDYFVKDNRHVWIEMKAPGGTPSALQWEEIYDLRAHGAEAWWCDSLEQVQLILLNAPGMPDRDPSRFKPQEKWML